MLAGYPLVGLKATLYDGSYHPVDSNEMAFKTAAQLAYKEGDVYKRQATDTGCFVYSNTTPETHRIAAALMAVGFDAQWVNRRHFRVKSLKRMQLEGRLVQEMELSLIHISFARWLLTFY